MFKFWNLIHSTLLDAAGDGSGGGSDLDILADPEKDSVDDKDDKVDEDKEEDKDDDIVEEDKDDDKDDEDKEDEDEEKDDEDKDDEDEDEEEEEDKLDDERITHASDLKKAYPDIFKKFPDVKAALYRDQRYGEMFANPDEADTVVKQATLLRQIEKDLIVDSNPKELLLAVKKDNADSYKKIIRSILPMIQGDDKELYLEVSALPIKQLLRAAFRAGDGKKTDLGKAALYIHKYFFDDYEVDSKVSLENLSEKKEEKSQKEKDLEDRLNKIDEREYNNFNDAVSTSYVTRMKDVITDGMKNDDRLTEYTKTKLVEDIMADIKDQMWKDPRYVKQIQALWNSAKAAGYTNDFKSRIVSTALARAKSLVPAVRAKKVSEALGRKKKSEDKEEKVVKFKREDRTDRTESRREQRQPQDKSKRSNNPDLDILRNG